MNGEVETGRVVCGGRWAKKVDHAVTKDIPGARNNFMKCFKRSFLQWPLYKDDNDESEDDFSQKSTIVM